MSRSGLSSIAVVMLAAVGLGWWLGAPDRSHDEELVVSVPGASEGLPQVPQSAPNPLPVLAEFDAPYLPPALPLVPEDVPADSTGTTSMIVTVLIDGKPLVGVLAEHQIDQVDVRVLATFEPPPSTLDESLAPAYDKLGVGKFEDHTNWWDEDKIVGPPGCLGQLSMPAHFPMHVSVALGSTILATRQLVAAQEAMTFELSSATLIDRLGGFRLRVVSAETHKPIAGAQMEMGILDMFTDHATTVADQAGLIVRSAVSGPHSIVVKAAGFERVQLEVPLANGPPRELGDIALSAATRVSGVVRLPTGEPAEDAVVALVPEQSPVDALFTIGMSLGPGRTNAGHFDLPQCGRRRSILVAFAGVNAATTPIDTRQGDVADVELTLAPGTSLSVRLPAEPLDSVRLRLWTAGGTRVSSWPGMSSAPSDTEWSVPLVPGDYVLAINSARHGQMTEAIAVGATPAQIDLVELLK